MREWDPGRMYEPFACGQSPGESVSLLYIIILVLQINAHALLNPEYVLQHGDAVIVSVPPQVGGLFPQVHGS